VLDAHRLMLSTWLNVIGDDFALPPGE
jgi:hypothetical protein